MPLICCSRSAAGCSLSIVMSHIVNSHPFSMLSAPAVHRQSVASGYPGTADWQAARCSRIIAKPPSESAVKAWFYNMTNSLQQIRNDEGAFPALFPRSILTLVSNCRNFRSASPSFSKDGCTHTVKSVLRLTKRPNNVTPRISAHEIHFCHTKTQQNDSCIKS